MSSIPKSFIEDLKNTADIESVVSSYVQLQRRGKIAVGLCPFHSEKTGSFTVYPDTQSYFCFGCGAGGDTIGFIERIENISYVEAVKLLAEKYGMTVPEEEGEDRSAKLRVRILEMNREAAHFFHDCLVNTEEGRKEALGYLLGRGFTSATITHFGLGYAPESWDSLTRHLMSKGYTQEEMQAADLARISRKGTSYDVFKHRVITPIIDLRGNVVGFSGRRLGDSDPKKYYNTSDTPVYKKTSHLFALNFAKKEKGMKYIILGEGAMDVMAMHQAGCTSAVASLGTALTADQCRSIASYTSEVILAYDNDAAGQKATKRAVKLLDAAGIRSRVLSIPQTPGVKDPDEYIKKFGPEAFRKIVDESRGSTEYGLSGIMERHDLDDPTEKVQAVREAVAFIAELTNSVEREIWCGKLSQDLGISKEGIMANVTDIIKKKHRAKELREVQNLDRNPQVMRMIPEAVRNPAEAAAEEKVLEVLFRFPEETARICCTVNAESFTVGLYRRVFEKILEARAGGYDVSLSILGEDFSMEEKGYMSGLINRSTEKGLLPEDGTAAAAKMAELGARKSDTEIASMDNGDLGRYVADMIEKKKQK